MEFLEIFQKDIKRNFDPVVSVEQVDEQILEEETNEFIFTKVAQETSIFMGTEKAYVEGMNFISQCPIHQYPNIWIYGFYGCGKSLLAKMLSLSLENKNIGEHSITDILTKKISQNENRIIVQKSLQNLKHIHSKTIIFNVGYQKRSTEQLHHVIARKILHRFNYRDDLPIAMVELFLQKENLWDDFLSQYQEKFSCSWGNDTTNDLQRTKILLQILFPNQYHGKAFSEQFEQINDVTTLCDKVCFAMSLSQIDKIIVCIDEISKHLDTYPHESKIFYEFIDVIFQKLGTKICFICTGQKKLDSIDSMLPNVFGKHICLDKAEPIQIVKERFLKKTEEGTDYIKTLFQNTNSTPTQNHIELYPFHHKVFQLIGIINTAFMSTHQTIQDKTTTRNLLEMTQNKFKNLHSRRFQDFDSVICIDDFYQDYHYSNDVSLFLQSAFPFCEQLEHAEIAKRLLKTLAILYRVQLQKHFQKHFGAIDEHFFYTHLQNSISNQKPIHLFQNVLRALSDNGLITKLTDGGYTISQTIHRRWKAYRNDLSIHEQDITVQLSTFVMSHFFVNKDLKTRLDNEISVDIHVTCQPETIIKSTNQIHIKVNIHPYNTDISKYDVQFRLPEAPNLQLTNIEDSDPKNIAVSIECTLENVEEFLRSKKTIDHFRNESDFLGEETLLQDCISNEESIQDENEKKIIAELTSIFSKGRLMSTKDERITIPLFDNQQDIQIESKDIEVAFKNTFKLMADILFDKKHSVLGVKIDDNMIQNMKHETLSDVLRNQLCQKPLQIFNYNDNQYRYCNDSDIANHILQYITENGPCKGSELIGSFKKIPYGYVSYTVRIVTVALFIQKKIQFRKDETSLLIKNNSDVDSDSISKNSPFNNLIFSIQSDTLTETETNILHQFIFTCTGEHYNSNMNSGLQATFSILKEQLQQHLYKIKTYNIPERNNSISSFLLENTTEFQNTTVQNYNIKEIFQNLYVFKEMKQITTFAIFFWDKVDWFLKHRSQLLKYTQFQMFMPKLWGSKIKIKDISEKIDNKDQKWSTIYEYLDDINTIEKLWSQSYCSKKEELIASKHQILENIHVFVMKLNEQEKMLCNKNLLAKNPCLFYHEENKRIEMNDTFQDDLYVLDTQIKKIQQDFSELLKNGPTESSKIASLELHTSTIIRSEEELQEFFDKIKQQIRLKPFQNSIMIKKL